MTTTGTDAVGGKFPILFESVKRPKTAVIEHLPAVPQRNDLIRFGEGGPRYIVIGVTWTPNDRDAIAEVRLEGLDTLK
jgi:hypothetical protein